MEKGQRLFAENKYTDAVDEFSSAYDKHKFTAFLFNAGVAAERAGQRDRAIDFYTRFLAAEPNAPDKAAIEKSIERLRQEKVTPPTDPLPAAQRAEIKSLVFIESEPIGAPISVWEKVDPKAPLFDPKKPDQVGYRKVITGLYGPTNVSVNVGTYFISVEAFRDYNPSGSQFTFESGRVYVYRASLSQGDFVGRVEINLPIASAQIYVDDPPPHKHAPRAVGPNSIELTPGKHILYIEAPGFEKYEQEVIVVQGQTMKLDAALQRVKYGYVLVTGDADEVEVEVDGDEIGVYRRKSYAPLRIKVPAGEHFIEVDASGRKAYEATLSVPAGKEVLVDAKLEEAPGKGGAIVTTILAAAFLGGGIVLNRYAEGLAEDDDLKDPMKGLWIGCFAGAGLFTGLSVFLFAFDPSDDSTARLPPPTEFTGESDKYEVKPKLKTTGARSPTGPRVEVGLTVAGPSLTDVPYVTIPVTPTGLVVSGRF